MKLSPFIFAFALVAGGLCSASVASAEVMQFTSVSAVSGDGPEMLWITGQLAGVAGATTVRVAVRRVGTSEPHGFCHRAALLLMLRPGRFDLVLTGAVYRSGPYPELTFYTNEAGCNLVAR